MARAPKLPKKGKPAANQPSAGWRAGVPMASGNQTTQGGNWPNRPAAQGTSTANSGDNTTTKGHNKPKLFGQPSKNKGKSPLTKRTTPKPGNIGY